MFWKLHQKKLQKFQIFFWLELIKSVQRKSNNIFNPFEDFERTKKVEQQNVVLKNSWTRLK